MANPVGALFSLIGGLNTEPSQVRNAAVADKRRLDLEFRKMVMGDKFARDELASNVGIANKQMQGVDRRFDKEIDVRQSESAAGRSQERTIQEMQQKGRVDLQELIGAQEATRQAESATLAQLLQRDSQEFQAQQQSERLAATGVEAASMLAENKRQFDADLAWKQRNGKHEEAMNAVSLRLATLQSELAERQNAQLPTDEEIAAQKEYRKQIDYYAIEEMKYKYATRMSPEMVNELNQMQLRLGQAELEGKQADTEATRTKTALAGPESEARIGQAKAETELTKATTAQKQLETDIVKGKMEGAKDKEKEKGTISGDLITDDEKAQQANISRLVTQREKGIDFKPFGSTSGHEAAAKAYDALGAETNDSDVAKKVRADLREVIPLLEKAGEHAMDRSYWEAFAGGALLGGTTQTLWNVLDAAFGPDWKLDKDETARLEKGLSNLKDKYGIDLLDYEVEKPK